MAASDGSDPSLIPALVEESIRWTTPIHQFVRLAAADQEVRGQTVRKGDWVVLCFPSGNRDEDVFEDPFRFRIDRASNKHISSPCRTATNFVGGPKSVPIRYRLD